MKRKKFIALLCVAAMSASLVTPVMAEENTAEKATQETTAELKTPAVETEASKTEETTAPEEAAPAEDQVPVTDAEQAAPEVSAETTIPTQEEAESSDEDAEVKDGFVEEDGKVYYYEKGSLVTNRIIDFEEEDGTTYVCYFHEDGSMMIDNKDWVDCLVEEGSFRNGYIRADENGHLITGWYEISAESTPYGKVLYEYYDSDCFQVTNDIVEVNGNKYYLGSNGYLVTDSQVMFEGKLYEADADGVFTESKVTEKEQWVEVENQWYLYVDGKLITNRYYTYEGDTYYFDDFGVMKTGVFWDKDGEEKLAELSGIVFVNPAKGWNQSKDGKLWYYFKEENGVLHPAHGEVVTTLDGKKYGFDYNGIMQTGVFEAQEDGKYNFYYANADGVIQQKDGWFLYENNWYYSEDGKLYTSGFYRIGNEKYGFDYHGVMLKGNGTYWFDNEPCRYLTNDSGVIQESNGWVKYDGNWYYWKDGDTINEGIHTIDGKDYYFEYGVLRIGRIKDYPEDGDHNDYKLYITDASGALLSKSGWNLYNGSWYYMSKDGYALRDQVVEDGNKMYYVDSNGKMKIGDFYEGGYRYHTDSNGVILKNSWYLDGYDWYYAKADGTAMKNDWLKGSGNVWYYMDSHGAMAKGTCWVGGENGRYNLFDDNGIWKGELATNGWTLVNGTWFYYENGKPYTGWTGDYYIVEGKMAMDRFIYTGDDEKVYYVNYKGVYQRNCWIEDYDGWYYAGSDGALITNDWKNIGGVDYYFDGVYMASNAIVDTGEYGLCKFDKSGRWTGYVKNEGWQQVGDKWYYVDSDGNLVTNGKHEIGGKTYYFYYDGVMYANTLLDYGVDPDGLGHVWINKDGVVSKENGWKYVDGRGWCYLEDGKAKTGWLKSGKNWYYLTPYMSTGYVRIWDDNGYEYEWNYFNQDGVWSETKLKDGWSSVTENGHTKWYYTKNGAPLTEQWYNGNYFNWDGSMATGTVYTESEPIYLYDENGYLLKNGWHKFDGDWYYTDAKGKVYTGERSIGGKTYWFNEGGVWIK